jgi:glycosyltransferase involved in cell wall biosynthesis
VLKGLSFRLIERQLLERAAFVHYTTEQERIEAAACGFAHRPMVIPNPVEVPDASGSRSELRRRFPELQERRIALFLSRIDRKKGLDLLIPAFAGVLREMPDSALVIAGDGDTALIAALKTQCCTLGIAGSVYWTGFLSGREKAGALADADIFVLPSWSENFGIAPIEAMALGVPVIVTDQVGIHREIASQNAGVVTPAAIEPLRSAMARLLADSELRTTLGRNGMQLARSEFSPPVVIRKLTDAYRTVPGAN